jgi:hypothetical protein
MIQLIERMNDDRRAERGEPKWAGPRQGKAIVPMDFG